MAWNDVIVDLNKSQKGVDVTLMAPYVAGVLVHLGAANLEDPAAPIYDTEAANHVNEAAIAKIPLVGLSVDMNASMWGSGGWNVPLSDVKSQPRTKNPMYVFVKNFLTPMKTVQFIVLVLGASTESATWNIGELQAMIAALEAGMKAGEIQKLKIMVASTPAFVRDHCYDATQKINLFENMFYREDGSCPYGVMVQEAASISGTYTWQTMQATPPLSKSKPSAYLGAYPNPMLWQWLLGGVYLPFNVSMNKQFGISSMWNGKAAFYKWAGVTTDIPPVTHTCPEGYAWNDGTQKCELVPVIPPVLPGTLEAKVDALTVELAALRADVKKLLWLGK